MSENKKHNPPKTNIESNDESALDDFKSFEPEEFGENHVLLDVFVKDETKTVNSKGLEMCYFLGSMNYNNRWLSIQISSPWDKMIKEFQNLRVNDKIRVWGTLWQSGKYYSVRAYKIEKKV